MRTFLLEKNASSIFYSQKGNEIRPNMDKYIQGLQTESSQHIDMCNSLQSQDSYNPDEFDEGNRNQIKILFSNMSINNFMYLDKYLSKEEKECAEHFKYEINTYNMLISTVNLYEGILDHIDAGDLLKFYMVKLALIRCNDLLQNV